MKEGADDAKEHVLYIRFYREDSAAGAHSILFCRLQPCHSCARQQVIRNS